VEALLATLALLLVIVGGLMLLARVWPRSSRLGGYRGWKGSGSDRPSAQAQERGEAIREDDDGRWHWRDPESPDRPDPPGPA
jgi:hypothetical protein